MLRPLRLKSPLGRTYHVDPDDTLQAKETLRELGYYSVPTRYGMTPYPDERMFQAVEQFQDDFDLQQDGVMNPNGETAAKINEVLSRWQSVSRMPSNPSSPEASPNQGTQEAALPAVPFLIYEIAAHFGMAVSAAYAWWLSLSAEEKQRIRDQISAAVGHGISDDEIEDECDEMHYKIDIPTCRQIAKTRGNAAGAKCYASANERYAACRDGRPIPPLNTWNN